MKNKIISIIALCLAMSMLSGCGSATTRRRNKVLSFLEDDLLEVDYTVVNAQTSEYRSNVYGEGSLGGSYLFSTGTHYYVSNFKGELDAYYEINKISFADGSTELVTTVPYVEGFNDIVMINTDYYLRYKVEEVYDDLGHAALGFPNSYEYKWYKFDMEGLISPTGYVYPSDDIMYSNQCAEMVKDVRDKMILSAMSLTTDARVERLYTAPGIMSTLSDLAGENEDDKLEFVEICGYDPSDNSAVLRIDYRVSDGYKLIGQDAHYRLHSCSLLDSQGEIRYIGKYEDLIKNDGDEIIILK